MRKGKQVRERWLSILDPKINQRQWTVEEEISFIRKWLLMGNKWKQISDHMGGRCESQCKNRFKLILRREHVKESQSETELRQMIKHKILKNLIAQRNKDM